MSDIVWAEKREQLLKMLISMGFDPTYAERAVYFVDVTSPNAKELCFHWMEENNQGSKDKETLAAAQKSLEESENEAVDQKFREKVNHVMNDIVVAEKSYAQNMRIIVDHFANPLKDLGKAGKIDKTSVSKIVGNIEDISNFHQLLWSELKKCKDPINVGEVFLQFADFLKMYTIYVNGYDRCCDTVDSLRKNKHFVSFLKSSRKDPACQGRDMMSFLIMPVQRLPLYELLMKRLIKAVKKCSDEEGNVVEILSTALDKVVQIANQINESKRKAEERSRLLDIQSRLTGDDSFHIISPTRRLIKEGKLLKLSLFNMKKTRLVFVFNDVVLWTTDSHRIRGYIDLPRCQVELLSKPTDNLYAFEILHPNHNTLTLYCKSKEEAQIWVDVLNEAINNSTNVSIDEAIVRTRSKSVVAGTDATLHLSKSFDRMSLDHVAGVSKRAVDRLTRAESQHQMYFVKSDHEPSTCDVVSSKETEVEDEGESSDSSSPPSPPPLPPQDDNIPPALPKQQEVPGSSQKEKEDQKQEEEEEEEERLISPSGSSYVVHLVNEVRDHVTLTAELEAHAKILRKLDYEDIISLLDLVELGAPVFIQKVLEATGIVLGVEPTSEIPSSGKPDYWIATEKLLSKPHCFRLLQGFSSGKIISLAADRMEDLGEYISNPLMDPEMVDDYSPEAGILWNWVRSVYAYQKNQVLEDAQDGAVKPRLRKKKKERKTSSRVRGKTPVASSGKKVGRDKNSRRGTLVERRRKQSSTQVRRSKSIGRSLGKKKSATGDRRSMDAFRKLLNKEES